MNSIKIFKRCVSIMIMLWIPVMMFGQDAELLKKAEAGDAWAQYEVANHFLPKTHSISEEGMSWLIKSAENGVPFAQRQLINAYECGWYGLAENDEKYVYWLKKCAENTNIFTTLDKHEITWAQYELGELYNYGRKGLPKDKYEYLKWAKKSANNGYKTACYSLGLHFQEKGEREEAIYWLKKGMDLYWDEYHEEDEFCAKSLRELNVSYHPGSSKRSSSGSSMAESSSSSSTSSDTPLFKGTYTISGTGYSAMGQINGIEAPGQTVEIYRDYIKVNGSKCKPTKYYGEWTWYDGGWYGIYAVGPGYQMKNIIQNPYGDVYLPMYLEDGSEYANQSGSTYDSSGYTGGSNSGNSSSSTFDYESQYRRYERLAQGAYNSLTTLGSQYNNNGQISGTIGNRSNIGGNVVTLKRNLRDAQKNMQRIRNEASQHGVTIPQSSWETATVQ